MKKVILLLSIIFGINVYAQENLDDYEFVEYTQEKQIDEFLYEEVTLNRFYLYEEGNIEYLERNEDPNKQYIDTSQFIKEDVCTEDLPKNRNAEATVALGFNNDYFSEKIIIDNLLKYTMIDKIDIFIDNAIIKTLTQNDLKESIIIELGEPVTISKIKIVFNYEESSEPIEFNITYESKTKNHEINTTVILNNNLNTTNIITEKTDNYIENENLDNIPDVSKRTFYCYEKIRYKHYDFVKKYVIDYEGEYYLGYAYDPNESYKAYKKYKKREVFDSDNNNADKNENSEKDENTEPEISNGKDDKTDFDTPNENTPENSDNDKDEQNKENNPPVSEENSNQTPEENKNDNKDGDSQNSDTEKTDNKDSNENSSQKDDVNQNGSPNQNDTQNDNVTDKTDNNQNDGVNNEENNSQNNDDTNHDEEKEDSNEPLDNDENQKKDEDIKQESGDDNGNNDFKPENEKDENPALDISKEDNNQKENSKPIKYPTSQNASKNMIKHDTDSTISKIEETDTIEDKEDNPNKENTLAYTTKDNQSKKVLTSNQNTLTDEESPKRPFFWIALGLIVLCISTAIIVIHHINVNYAE